MKCALRLIIGLGMLMLFCCAPHFSTTSVAQEKKGKVITEKAQKARGDAKDENIKGGSDINKAGVDIPAPPQKGGAKSRGTSTEGQVSGIVAVQNNTSLYVRIYVDGVYKGVVGPWADAAVYGETPFTIYGVAVFDDGSALYWGPKKVYDGDSFRMTR